MERCGEDLFTGEGIAEADSQYLSTILRTMPVAAETRVRQGFGVGVDIWPTTPPERSTPRSVIAFGPNFSLTSSATQRVWYRLRPVLFDQAFARQLTKLRDHMASFALLTRSASRAQSLISCSTENSTPASSFLRGK